MVALFLKRCYNKICCGAIAQLGERLHGMQEVVGSNPISSIFLRAANCRSFYLALKSPEAGRYEEDHSQGAFVLARSPETALGGG